MTTSISNSTSSLVTSNVTTSSPYCIYQSEAFSYKPILSLDTLVCLDGECIVAGSTDRVIRFLDPTNLDELARTEVSNRSVSFLSISDMGINGEDPMMVTGGMDVIHIWKPVEGIIGHSATLPSKVEVRSISVYVGKYWKLAWIGTRSGKLILWDIERNLVIREISGHLGSVHSVAMEMMSSTFVPEKTIQKAIKKIKKRINASSNSPTSPISNSSVSFPFTNIDNPEDTLLCGSSHENDIQWLKFYETLDQEAIEELSCLCFVSGSADRVVRSWNIFSGRRIQVYRHQRSTSSILIADAGERSLLITAGVERIIKLWDLRTATILRTLTGHLDDINCLHLWNSPYRMLLFSGSNDHTIRVYDVVSGECICILQGHCDAILSLTIVNASSNTPQLISSSDDLTLRLWDIQKILNEFYTKENPSSMINESFSSSSSSTTMIGEINENIYGLRRNSVPAYLPNVDYVAPEELDRLTLTKDERKRIVTERRRQKREKHLPKYLQSLGNRSPRHGSIVGDDEMLSSIISSHEEMKEKGGICEVKCTSTDENSHDETLDFELGIESDDLWEALENELHEDELDGNFSIDVHVPGEGGDDNADRKAPISQVQANNSSKQNETTSHRNSKDEIRNAHETHHPLSDNDHEVRVRVARTWVDSLISGFRGVVTSHSRRSSIVGIEPMEISSSLSISSLSPIATPVATPIANSLHESSRKRISIDSNIAGDNSRRNSSNISSTRPTENTATDSGAASKAREARSAYMLANVQAELNADRSRSAASQKLTERLASRRTKSFSEESKTNESAERLQKDEFEKLKADKIKEHQMQQSRRKQSMMFAQQRSGAVLQRRLEEIAAKKAASSNDNGILEEETESDDE